MEGFKGAGLASSYRGVGSSEVSNASDDTAKSLMGGGWMAAADLQAGQQMRVY